MARRFLTIFDPDLPMRLAVGGYARERFGAGAEVAFLDFYRAAQEELVSAG